MNWESFFAALTGAIPGIGVAVLAIWKSYTKQRDEAAARRKATHDENDVTKRELEELKALILAQTAEQKKANTAMRSLTKRVNDFIEPLT